MDTRLTVLVLGGGGFIGRHAVAALRERGCRTIVGSRYPHRRQRGDPESSRSLRGDGLLEYRETHFERLCTAKDWAPVLGGVDRVVNCVGILRERGRETYDRVHHRAPAALAAACAARGLRLIHVSALGLDGPARSGFLTSKRDGEAALRASTADWHIVRPSLLDGEGGYGARWIRRVAHWPIHPLPRAARGRITVLDVRDLGEAIAVLALHGAADDVREHELGGLQARTLAAHLAAMRALHSARPALLVAVPDALTRCTAHVCDLFHLTPLSFGHWELLQRDNRPRHNALPALLGRAPRTVGACTDAADVPATATPVKPPAATS